MEAKKDQTSISRAVLSAVVLALAATGCTTKTTGGEQAGLGAIGEPGGAGVATGAGSAGQTGNATAGAVAASGGKQAAGMGGSSGGPLVTQCPVGDKPVCAGLAACPLTICYNIVQDKLTATCSCLTGESLTQCCAKVKETLKDCMDYEKYPECKAAGTGAVKGPCTVDETARLEAAKQPMSCYMTDLTSGCQTVNGLGVDVTPCLRNCVSAAVPNLSPACLNCFPTAQQKVNDACFAECGSPICVTIANCMTSKITAEFYKCYSQ